MNAKENTMRALAGKTLLVKSWKCSFNLHKWTMWVETKDGREMYSSIRQKRYCVNCNLRDEKI